MSHTLQYTQAANYLFATGGHRTGPQHSGNRNEEFRSTYLQTSVFSVTVSSSWEFSFGSLYEIKPMQKHFLLLQAKAWEGSVQVVAERAGVSVPPAGRARGKRAACSAPQRAGLTAAAASASCRSGCWRKLQSPSLCRARRDNPGARYWRWMPFTALEKTYLTWKTPAAASRLRAMCERNRERQGILRAPRGTCRIPPEKQIVVIDPSRVVSLFYWEHYGLLLVHSAEPSRKLTELETVNSLLITRLSPLLCLFHFGSK